ncbi:putative 2,3-dihydroxybiphenyl 1,2-dioxygenase [Aeromicrobium marinum DSM 15272]|uniref:2,3-dihydroxybiphenyl 1,2-dioxygenase n=1 Tax=Aeromicrobium marinum DSM 15272 TaxID=585531 RepID=E2S882_9ACTN|nr:VOC family protein [Aeromicrobium marinum]EFQ84387.1 putative 2,3-dihydroxybiphenyl 1,2-dioxygenase [Aeromicrobium marinum DSM 15272]
MNHRLMHSLGYLGVTTPRAEEWPDFARRVFGMEVVSDETGAHRMRWDDRAFRLAVHPGDTDEVAYIGWESRDSGDLDRITATLRSRGVEVVVESAEVANQRMVSELVSFHDPFGIRHEVYAGAVEFDRSFRGERSTTKFRTGPQGLGHAVLVVPDLEVGTAFYEEVLGLVTTDVVHHGPALGTMRFLRCNTRHHSIALWEMPGRLLGLQHLMVESESVDEVGRAYDTVQTGPWEVSATLGRHVGDEQMSFYTRTPSGFDIELGCDSIDIDDATWTMRLIDKTAGAPNEVWGHHWRDLGPQSSLRAVETWS